MGATVGPFVLGDLIAHGGMGNVYRAQHAVEGYSAAIKVVDPQAGTNDALLREVRATASLNHPAVVVVYDYGEVSEVASRATNSELAAGSLWFAMELADAGTLEDLQSVDHWGVVRHVVLEILDALAHAHARGLIHRDLKPANILLQHRTEGLGLLVADFGIAHIGDSTGAPSTPDKFSAPAAGTPRYMAPEQIEGRWRDQGPWTDLYALGCVAWELVTKKPLFGHESAVAVAFAHLSDPVGPFEPAFEVPEGFEDWLRVLLSKHWRDRYQRAAHAAYALAQLSPAPSSVPPELLTRTLATDPAQLPTLGTMELAATIPLPSVELRAIRSADRDRATGLDMRPIGVPPDWRHSRPPKPLGGNMGLALFGLRDVPLMGRESARDNLWHGLFEAARSRQASATVLAGGEGLGKSKLLRWLAVRAEELGVATVIAATHSRLASSTSGLEHGFARHLGCVGLDFDAALRRLEEVCPPDMDRAPLAALVSAAARQTLRFTSPTERYAIFEAYLRAQAQRGPLLLAIDDTQWGADALALVQHLWHRLETTPDLPLHVLLTVRPGELNEHPLAAKRLRALREHERTSSLELDPLESEAHVALIREHVGLAPELAERLVAAAGANTNYSLCVIADLVQREELILSGRGYELVGEPVFPAGLHAAWDARIERFCAEFPSPATVAEALEAAAALGTDVDWIEWQAVCTARGLGPIERIGARLIDCGIAVSTDVGFMFTQSAVVEALAQRTGGARRRELHRDCAAVIELAAATGASAAERRALHLLRGEDIPAAARELRVAIDERLATSAYDEAVMLADAYLNAGGGSTEETLVVRARRADALRYLGRSDAAEAEANAILTAAATDQLVRGRAEGLRVLAGLAHSRGDPRLGVQRYDEAFRCFERAQDSLGMARCAHGRGWLLLNASRFAAARIDFMRGLELARMAQAANDTAWSRQGLAEATLYSGKIDEAEQAALLALREFELLGSRSGQGMALASLANVARERNLVPDAREGYDRAVRLLQSLQSPLAGFALLHRVVLELTMGDDDALRDAIERCKTQPLPVAFRLVAALGACVVEGAERAGSCGAARGSGFDATPDDLALSSGAGPPARSRDGYSCAGDGGDCSSRFGRIGLLSLLELRSHHLTLGGVQLAGLLQ